VLIGCDALARVDHANEDALPLALRLDLDR
jgi:hypothetical protein